MFFDRALWMFGLVTRFDSFRRGFVGGTALSLFIIKEFGLEKQAVPALNALRKYLALEKLLLSIMPDYLEFFVMPFNDYHNASTVFLKILDMLAELQRPRSCQYYW